MLKARIITSLILIPAFLAALFLLPEFFWSLLMLCMISIGAWEWSAMALFRMSVRVFYTSATLIIGLSLLYGVWSKNSYLLEYTMFFSIPIAVVFWIMLVPIWLTKRFQIQQPIVMALVGWIILFPTWVALICLREGALLKLVNLQGAGSVLLLGIMLTVWIADSAAYFSGKKFGKHKLAPQISPGKTWEGVIGALVVVTLYGAVLSYFYKLGYSIILLLWTITILSIVGDLLESLIKRQANLKDSGHILPGHGGVMDRIDGLTSSLPVAAFYVYFPIYYAAIKVYV